ncbi:hypothetical protein EAF00_009160 [Botryotinia globosa]|nr:hypothetical protein EAF00_009160 [Botryotinia globosa]
MPLSILNAEYSRHANDPNDRLPVQRTIKTSTPRKASFTLALPGGGAVNTPGLEAQVIRFLSLLFHKFNLNNSRT